MQIKITKEIYDKLSKDDRLRYIYIKTDPKFEKLILTARKNLNITPKVLKNLESNLYATDKNMQIFTAGKEGKLVPYNDWIKRKKDGKTFRKQAHKEINKILNKYPVLNSKWYDFLYMLVCYDISNFLPNKYSFVSGADGTFHIVIDRLVSPTDLTKWIKSNWESFKEKSDFVIPKTVSSLHKKKSYIPDYVNLERVIKIIKLKKVNKKSSEIIPVIDKTEKTNEVAVDKMYHLITKQLRILEKETREKQRIDLSTFSR